MTIAEAISEIDTLKPNDYTNADKIKWLSRLDSLIYEEIYCSHQDNPLESFDGYTGLTDTSTELFVKEPYDNIYRFWLEAQIDYSNAELGKYNNSITMYNAAYTAFQNSYNRAHMPLTHSLKFF